MTDSAQYQAPLTEWLRSMPNVQDIEWQLKKAESIRQWCITQLPVREGQRVRIVTAPNCDNGWAPYREALAVGATATVVRIDFNPYSYNGEGAWHANIRLDREWSHSEMHDGVHRWWNGPVGETPEGMAPPSKYDQEHYPEGRRHLFSLLADCLAPADSEVES